MASPFQRYQSGIEASTGNLVQAYGQMAGQTANAIAGFGQNLAEGIKKYNQNAAENEILDGEAQALSQQIFGFQQMFADPQTGQINPEYAPFAESLTPDIQTLAKFNSMSLNQKKGVMTGMKARFANIGQNLAAFEMTKKARLQQDMNVARGGVREFDEQTVPTSIIPSGKLPYFYNKNYTEQEGELVRLAGEAKARGANVDLPSVLDNWRKGLKANAMSRPDLPANIKEALVKQIDAGEGLTDNIQTDESGVTDYAKEAEMYDKASTSVKEQLAPPKVEAPANKGTAPDDKVVQQSRALIEKGIANLEKMNKKTETLSDSEFNKLVDKDPAPSRYTKVANLEAQGWRQSVDDKGKVTWSKETEDKQVSEALAVYRKELDRLPKPQKPVEDVAKTAEEELKNVDSQIKALEEAIANDETPVDSGTKQALQTGLKLASTPAIALNKLTLKNSILNSDVPLTREAIREWIKENNESVFGKAKQLAYGAWSMSSPVQAWRQTVGGRTITKKEDKLVDAEIENALLGKEYKLSSIANDPTWQLEALKKQKVELENRMTTGKINASPADISKAQQAAKPAEAKPEPEYALTNQYNMAIGTTTAQVATSLESKRNDMKTFFQNKYGYVPASFEESFKAIYPEANFKTMETPYGVFMYDGKDWKQVQVQQAKTMTPKEIAENKAVSFGKTIAGGMTDVNEFGELVPNSGVYVRGIFSGSPTEAFKFKQQMLEASNAKKAVGRLIEINEMVGESMPWNAKVWGEAKALLPQIKAGLRTDIIGVGTVSNYEQQLIEEVVANPTLFWSLESSDRAKLAVIMDKISNRLIQEPANHGLEVKVAGRPNAEIERRLKLGNAGKSKLELDFEARGGKGGLYTGGSTGAKLNWNLANKIPDALKD